MTRNSRHIEKETNRLVKSNSYKGADFDSRQSDLMNLQIEYRGKKISLAKLYNNILGYSDNSVICGKCDRRGTIRKRGQYYEVRHSNSTRDTCYFGKNPRESVVYVPTRVIDQS